MWSRTTEERTINSTWKAHNYALKFMWKKTVMHSLKFYNLIYRSGQQAPIVAFSV